MMSQVCLKMSTWLQCGFSFFDISLHPYCSLWCHAATAHPTSVAVPWLLPDFVPVHGGDCWLDFVLTAYYGIRKSRRSRWDSFHRRVSLKHVCTSLHTTLHAHMLQTHKVMAWHAYTHMPEWRAPSLRALPRGYTGKMNVQQFKLLINIYGARWLLNCSTGFLWPSRQRGQVIKIQSLSKLMKLDCDVL